MSARYRRSEELLNEALRVIPLASQTFSKSKAVLPFGVSPYFVDHAKGSHMWDVDGNEYIDFVNGLACVTLGYCDPDVDAAVRDQIGRGVTFSLPHQLEMDVAQLMVEMIPCAEKVRFAKNGTDATSGAVRVARAYTGRERVAVCGYHGWQDWYIGSTSRDLGVPRGVKELVQPFKYNDPQSLQLVLQEHSGEFAAVILEPMNAEYPRDGFLEAVRDTAHDHGAVLIFDETITGFRYSLGGAQSELGVIPDMATFGKGMANGYPLSAVVGRTEFMRFMEEVFFSGTFGGETLSLAAAKAVLTKLRAEPVLETLKTRGRTILLNVSQLIAEFELGSMLAVTGHPSWSFLQFRDVPGVSRVHAKTFFLQEVFRRGIYALGTHNLSYAHSEADISALLECYREVFGMLRESIDRGTLLDRLECTPLVPIFTTR